MSRYGTAPVRGLRLGLLLLAGVLCGGAVVSGQTLDQADLRRIEAYLNDLGTLRSRFLQIAPDGATSTGTLLYKRPDKMRLDYDPPSEILVVANGWQLVYNDRRLEQETHTFTRSTPLSFLLEDQIRFGGDVTVTRAEQVGDELRVTLVQTEEPDQGALTLVFADDPVRLLRWAVVDAQGLVTHVILEQVESGVPLDNQLFSVHRPSPVERRDRD